MKEGIAKSKNDNLHIVEKISILIWGKVIRD